MISLGADLRDVGRRLEHLAAQLAGVDGEHALEVLDDGVVAVVVVAELRITVSDSTAPSSITAVVGLGSIPF